jgi:cell division protein FtsN
MLGNDLDLIDPILDKTDEEKKKAKKTRNTITCISCVFLIVMVILIIVLAAGGLTKPDTKKGEALVHKNDTDVKPTPPKPDVKPEPKKPDVKPTPKPDVPKKKEEDKCTPKSLPVETI